jgi:hypothetical protein
MNEFTVGDRIRVVEGRYHAYPEWRGATGIVTGINTYIEVRSDTPIRTSGMSELYFRPNEIEVFNPAPNSRNTWSAQ